MVSSMGASVVSSAGASAASSGVQAARARTLAAAKTGLSLMMDFMVLFPFVAETRARVVSTPLGLWQDIFLALAREGHAHSPPPIPRTLGNRAYSRVTRGGKEDKIEFSNASFREFRRALHLPCFMANRGQIWKTSRQMRHCSRSRRWIGSGGLGVRPDGKRCCAIQDSTIDLPFCDRCGQPNRAPPDTREGAAVPRCC